MAQRSSDVRREEILRLASSTGLANVEELSEEFGVTASTIRRDLAQLTTEGRLARTYGGAMVLSAHPESSLRQRAGEAFEAKGAIARWAAQQVSAGESVLLDAGSTVAALAHELRHRSDLRVATTGLTALEQLGDSPGVQVECLGGRFRAASRGFVGPLAEAALERMTFDRVFLGADGVTVEDGLCEAELEQTRLKEVMIRRSSTTYVLAHAAKLGARPFHAWARLDPPWTLVTDSGADPRVLEQFESAGVRVAVAPAATSVIDARRR